MIQTRSRQSTALCMVFFLSGTSALIFETLWFRLAGLALGNSVWASALVLSSFMGGLALGNALAAFHGHRIGNPIRFYAALEMAVGVSGMALVLLLPFFTEWLAPLFRRFASEPRVVNLLRLVISFVLMVIPATAMGMTLPLLVKALYEESSNFGALLGRLYGWNTLGAVAGALVTETIFVEIFGIRAAGAWACLFNFTAALGALLIAGNSANSQSPSGPSVLRLRALSASGVRVLLAGAVSGAVLLALEVIWFRFLTLFIHAYSMAFALMLSVVLAAIGLGGLVASWWLRKKPDAARDLVQTALLSGTLSIFVYITFHRLLAPVGYCYCEWYSMLRLVVPLTFPVSFLSGIIFTLIAARAHQEIGGSLETTGLLTMANTIGAMIGSAMAGFVFIPALGMEKSLFVLSLSYCLVALFAMDWRPINRNAELVRGLVAALPLIGVVLLFPFGAMEKYKRSVGEKFYAKDPRYVQVLTREGVNETSQYWQRQLLGKPLHTSLLTNSYSMSGSQMSGRRYMKFFVYLPIAIRPATKSALLICFGVGSTAKALTDTPSLKSIDVVDILRDILNNSSVIFPSDKDNPLKDPRVGIHVEDGRFFLQTTDRHFDLITAEPPPPQLAGVVNLYSREFFQLMYDRLADGGTVTYWLPVKQLRESATKSVLKAFSEVFHDCSLWTGFGYEWMMVGTKNASTAGPVSEKAFCAQWEVPHVRRELQRCGFEVPEQIGATFMMDSFDLQQLTRGAEPVVDDFPHRVLAHPGHLDQAATDSLTNNLDALMEWSGCRQRFEQSSLIRRMLPETLRRKALDFFWIQGVLNEAFTRPDRGTGGLNLQQFHRIVTQTSLKFPIYWIGEGDNFIDQDDLKQAGDQALKLPGVHKSLALQAMGGRNFSLAQEHLAQEMAISPSRPLIHLRVYCLCMAREYEEARKLVRDHAEFYKTGAGANYLKWLNETFPMAML